MPEILHVPDEVTASRPLRAPSAVLDPMTAAIVDQAVAEAEERAHREGEIAGRRAALEETQRAVHAVQVSLDAVRAELEAQRQLATDNNLEVIRAVAQAVLDRTPPDDALCVLDRVRRAVEALDADRLEVRLNPADQQVLAEHVHDERLDLVADASVAVGDAVIGTAVAGAMLTRQALLDAALRALAEEGAP